MYHVICRDHQNYAFILIHIHILQMDSEGYVHLNVIGRFNRVRALTQDIELIKEVQTQ